MSDQGTKTKSEKKMGWPEKASIWLEDRLLFFLLLSVVLLMVWFAILNVLSFFHYTKNWAYGEMQFYAHQLRVMSKNWKAIIAILLLIFLREIYNKLKELKMGRLGWPPEQQDVNTTPVQNAQQLTAVEGKKEKS